MTKANTKVLAQPIVQATTTLLNWTNITNLIQKSSKVELPIWQLANYCLANNQAALKIIFGPDWLNKRNLGFLFYLVFFATNENQVLYLCPYRSDLEQFENWFNHDPDWSKFAYIKNHKIYFKKPLSHQKIKKHWHFYQKPQVQRQANQVIGQLVAINETPAPQNINFNRIKLIIHERFMPNQINWTTYYDLLQPVLNNKCSVDNNIDNLQSDHDTNIDKLQSDQFELPSCQIHLDQSCPPQQMQIIFLANQSDWALQQNLDLTTNDFQAIIEKLSPEPNPSSTNLDLTQLRIAKIQARWSPIAIINFISPIDQIPQHYVKDFYQEFIKNGS